MTLPTFSQTFETTDVQCALVAFCPLHCTMVQEVVEQQQLSGSCTRDLIIPERKSSEEGDHEVAADHSSHNDEDHDQKCQASL
ncbi:hypothetical protein CHARACLAT_007366 [Characodon lateralis]|uniref:Uncharacterized protein n=1 Tax=Characodon lateralis TaxID=208331 RepID=A0ABU7DZ34_9TELE|nr:hypothetical protein [Characodon lateralis]